MMVLMMALIMLLIVFNNDDGDNYDGDDDDDDDESSSSIMMDRNNRCFVSSCFRFKSVYHFYKYLLSRESDRRTTNFIAGDHQLSQYGRELEKLYVLTRAVASMDLSIPMELFMLDCTGINDVRHVIDLFLICVFSPK